MKLRNVVLGLVLVGVVMCGSVEADWRTSAKFQKVLTYIIFDRVDAKRDTAETQYIAAAAEKTFAWEGYSECEDKPNHKAEFEDFAAAYVSISSVNGYAYSNYEDGEGDWEAGEAKWDAIAEKLVYANNIVGDGESTESELESAYWAYRDADTLLHGLNGPGSGAERDYEDAEDELSDAKYWYDSAATDLWYHVGNDCDPE